tara:strand:- start:434 stop:658 length:225 start_codon:yes stop_codon:yes gene_type:complete
VGFILTLIRMPDVPIFVGVLFMNSGENFPQDRLKSMYWFKKAAAQCHHIGMSNLAFAYKKDDDVPQEFVEAYIL